MGEPAGIGPELIVKLLQKPWPVSLVIIGNEILLHENAQHLGLVLPDTIAVLNIPLSATVVPGKLAIANAPAVLQMLQCAVQGALQHEYSALVSGPIHKGIISQTGIPFSGHTEFFVQASGIAKPLMLLMNSYAKVALVTTHLPIKPACWWKWLFRTWRIRYYYSQLNAVARTRYEWYRSAGKNADTAFLPARLAQLDAIVAMYHDQGLPVVKQIDFANTVNITLGFPFIRTSVDHGVALDLAGQGKADVSSLRAAQNSR